jgi:hypothetical protein
MDEFDIVADQVRTKGLGTITKMSALRAWSQGVGLCLLTWIVTLPTAMVPILHLATVPTGIFGGLAIGFFVGKRKSGRIDLKSGQGPCPKCSRTMSLVFQDIGGNRAGGQCPDCRASYTIIYIRDRSHIER